MQNLSNALSTNSELRNLNWEQEFLKTFVNSHIFLVEESVQIGPDGWPYLYLCTDIKQSYKSEDQVPSVISWAYENGVGLVLNTHKEKPDYVFSYGMIWSFVHRGEFVNYTQPVFKENAEIYLSPVSQDLIPLKVLSFIKNYIQSAEVKRPRCALMTRDKIHYEFAVSIESVGNPPQSEHQGIAQGISWFLPMDMPVVLIYERLLQTLFEI